MVKYTNIYTDLGCIQRSLLTISKQRFLNIPVTVVLLRDHLKIFEVFEIQRVPVKNIGMFYNLIGSHN
jgi:hypothetical protein